MRARALWSVAVTALVHIGCFTDPPSATDDTSDTTGTTCAVGSQGCPCSADETCSEGLTCDRALAVCVDPQCAPGSELCACVDGQCLGSLVCDDGLCRGSAGTSGDTGAADSTSATSATTGSSATTTMTSEPVTGEVDDSGPPEGTASMSCSDLDCQQCGMCAASPEGECADHAQQCMADPGCAMLIECIGICRTPECAQKCCETTEPIATDLWTLLAACIQQACPNSGCPSMTPCAAIDP